MGKSKILRNNLSSAEVRKITLQYYLNKYYSLYMNRYKMNGVDYQARDFILRKFWGDGTISAYLLKETIGSDMKPKGELIFCPYAPNGWNIYDYPVTVNLINTKGVSFIPATPQLVDTDVVLGWCQRNKKSVREMVLYYVEKIVNIEIVIDINLNAHKMPYIIGGDVEDMKKLQEIMDLISADCPSLFVGLNEVEKFKALVSGAPYILDKLYNLKQAFENELKEYLGLDNLGGSEKKEHLITGEIEANNEVIKSSSNCFLDSMKEFFERINQTFNQNLSIELNEVEEEKIEVEEEEENDETI